MPAAGPSLGLPARPRALHLITGLGQGGAETALLRLLEHPSAQRLENQVLSLTAGGRLRPRFEAVVEVGDLGLRRGLPTPAGFWRLLRQARQRRPHLLVGWMYHGNLAASAVRPWLPGRVPVVWNVRHGAGALEEEKRLTVFLIRAGRWWSGSAARIVFNSRESARRHFALGYPEGKAAVLPNGIDCLRFRPRPGAKESLRRQLDLSPDAAVVGRVGRLHPVKDYPGLLAAAARVPGQVHWVLVGRGLEPEGNELQDAIREGGLGGRVHLLGEMDDLPELMAGFDLLCSNSLTEAFPNVVAEAMASGLPTVVTDTGESAELVGPTGRVVPPGDPPALAAAVTELLSLPEEERRRLGEAARRRVEERYSAEALLPRHGELWRRVLEEEMEGAP